MDLKPGMSWKDLKSEELDKGLLRDAAAGVAMAATIAAGSSAQKGSKELMQPNRMSPLEHVSDAGQVSSPDVPHQRVSFGPRLEEAHRKLASFKDRLHEVRSKMKESANREVDEVSSQEK